METLALLTTAGLQIVENWIPVLILSPAIAWAAIWGDCE